MAVAAGKGAGGGRSRGGPAGSSAAAAAAAAPPFSRDHALLSALLSLMAGLRGEVRAEAQVSNSKGCDSLRFSFPCWRLRAPSAPEAVQEVSGVLTAQRYEAWDGRSSTAGWATDARAEFLKFWSYVVHAKACRTSSSRVPKRTCHGPPQRLADPRQDL